MVILVLETPAGALESWVSAVLTEAEAHDRDGDSWRPPWNSNATPLKELSEALRARDIATITAISELVSYPLCGMVLCHRPGPDGVIDVTFYSSDPTLPAR